MELFKSRVYLVVINGFLSILTQVLLLRFYDSELVSSLFFVFLVGNYVGLIPNINATLTTDNSNRNIYGKLLKTTVILAFFLALAASIFLFFEDLQFSVFSVLLFLSFKSIEGILRQGLLINGLIHLDFVANLILSIVKMVCLTVLILLSADIYIYLTLLAFFHGLYVFSQWFLLNKFNSELNLSIQNGVSFLELILKSKNLYLNYILYSLVGAVDKFILRNSSDNHFVFLTIITTYLGYLTVFSQQLIQSKMTIFHKSEGIEFNSFNANYLKRLNYLIAILTTFFVLFAPLYLYFLFNILLDVKYIFVIIFMSLSNYFNLLTQVLNNFLYRRGLYQVQLNATLMAAPLVLLNLFTEIIGALLITSLVSFFSNVIYFYYSKYKLNGDNVLRSYVQ